MNEIKIFNNDQFGKVRVNDTNNEVLFCATDVCNSLGYSNTSKALSDHVDNEDRYNVLLERGGYMLFINESGLYSLILRSNLPRAKEYKKWVTSEVLPSIRRDGGYMMTNTNDTPETIMARALKIADETLKRKDEQIENQRIQLSSQAPKVLFADAVATSTKSCLIGELAKILCQNGIEIGERRLFQWLRDNEYLCKYGERYNMPSQKSMELCLFEIKKTSITKPNGTILVSNTPKVTGKGQIYFVNKLINIMKPCMS